MPTTPTDARLWINHNGRIVCLDHGGSYLRSHVRHCPDDVEEFSTPLDHWILLAADLVPPGFVPRCEDCASAEKLARRRRR